jgi:hypothetical protein
MNPADQVHDFALRQYILPARTAGRTAVTTVERERLSLQCQGLDLLRRFVTLNFDTMATKL